MGHLVRRRIANSASDRVDQIGPTQS